MTRVFRGILLTAGILVMVAGSARAQALGSIFGKVTDSTGGVLPGVTVTVTGTGLQQPLSDVTSATGAYNFPKVPIGTYSVTFELSGFKKVVQSEVRITTGFDAPINAKMEVGAMTTEVSVSGAAPVVDTKRVSTGGTFSKEILENIPTARDPWQVINMAPGVALSGYNVGGSASGQQLTPSVYGTSSNVQWNLEGGNITDMSSNSSPAYFNFDSFEEIQVITGGGDVSVQSSGLFINLVTKSGSNVFKGTATTTFENASMQSNNVTSSLFLLGTNGAGLSGNPLHKIGNYSAEYGGPILRNRLWFWGGWDWQDIHVGISNFYNTAQAGCNPVPTGYSNLKAIQACLSDDTTTIVDYNGKLNYQLNASNKFQYLYTSDNKVRNHRSASSSTALAATFQQYSPGAFPDPNHQITHTLILTDKLVFTNQLTYVRGGFFLDYQDWNTCGSSTYISELNGTTPTNPACIWNQQPLINRTTGYNSRGPGGSYQTQRPSWEVKTDGNYFLSNVLGGDHALKFGVGWRKNPVLTFTHTGGGAEAEVQCVNGTSNYNCGSGLNVPVNVGSSVPVGSAAGFVPYEAFLFRDRLTNYDWWTWSSYLQDSYSVGRVRINGGVRQDWQASKFLGGCVAANVIRPDLLPQQCQGTADPNRPFDNISPRVSATYDLFGNGKTSLHASYSYYYATEINLANGLSNLGSVGLTWGANQNSGACSTTAGAPCWTDANGDQIIQANELIGTPSASTSRFNTSTGVLSNVLPVLGSNLPIGRTREAIGGVDHELIPNVAVGVDFIYRKYDNGTASYNQGYQPDCATNATYPCAGLGFPTSQYYSTPVSTYTDPTTGISAPYYTICTGCVFPSGLGSISEQSFSYQTYKGVTVSARKRFSHRWQLNSSLTWNDERAFSPLGSYTSPTGLVFSNGMPTTGSSNLPYLLKVQGSVSLPLGINLATNLNVQSGLYRTQSINGPGRVYGGLTSAGAATTINITSLAFQNVGTVAYPSTKDMDVSLQKVVGFRGGKDRITLMLDCFNIFNVNTITAYGSSNLDNTNYTAVNTIIAPRVFRVGARIAF